MFGSFGIWELVIILFIVLLLFGVGRLPELGTGLGEGIKNFKKAYRDSKTLDVTPDEGERSPARTGSSDPARTPDSATREKE